jgi:hypothetical protein
MESIFSDHDKLHVFFALVSIAENILAEVCDPSALKQIKLLCGNC